MKFKNLKTGSIVTVTNKFVEEQMKNSDVYEEVKAEKKPENKEPKKGDK